jgi:hypothetical protein
MPGCLDIKHLGDCTMSRIILILTLVLLSSLSLFSQTANTKSDDNGVDYVLALSSANQFLTAWQWRRQEDGLKLLSYNLKKKKMENDLRDYLSGLSNPHHAAFEIYLGKRLDNRRISFQVQLYFAVTNDTIGIDQPKPSSIVMLKNGREQWLVDQLP